MTRGVRNRMTNMVNHVFAILPISLSRRKDKGGISFSSTAVNPKIDLEAAKAVCAEYRINNADILCTEDYEIDDLVDVIEGSRVYIPCIYAVNKVRTHLGGLGFYKLGYETVQVG